MDELGARWKALIEAINREFQREGEGREPRVDHDRRTLRLCARRALDGGREETITVRLTADEILSRPPDVLAHEFARTYYACT